MWFIYALLSAVTAALVTIFGKLGLRDLDSTFATTIRSIIMAIFLIGTSIIFKKFDYANISSMTSKDWIFIVCSGIAGALSWMFYFIALKEGPASNVASVDRLSIAFVIILSALILKESLTLIKIIGAILMIVGSITIVYGG